MGRGKLWNDSLEQGLEVTYGHVGWVGSGGKREQPLEADGLGANGGYGFKCREKQIEGTLGGENVSSSQRE